MTTPEIITVYSQDGLIALYAKGHVDLAAFRKAADEYKGEPKPDLDAFTPVVTHETWRCVPDRNLDGSRFVSAVPGARGTFPVTVISYDEWER